MCNIASALQHHAHPGHAEHAVLQPLAARLQGHRGQRDQDLQRGAGNTTEHRCDDGLSQPSARIAPLGLAMHYAYDSERNLVALVNAKGECHTLAYNRDELLVEETGFDGRVQRYQYDPAGQLVRHLQIGASADGAASAASAEPSWHSTAFERDPLGRAADQAFTRWCRRPLRLRRRRPAVERLHR